MATLGSQPMNAMRIEPDGATSGWYIWCGEELSQDDDFLEPLHTKHLPDHFPEMVKYLALGTLAKIISHSWMDAMCSSTSAAKWVV